MFAGTLPIDSQNSLALLGKTNCLSSCYMAGGSALALQLNHRQSIDFDFFSKDTPDYPDIKKSLHSIGRLTVSSETLKTLTGSFNGIKFSLFHYPYPVIRPFKKFLGINIACPEDISAMKLVAITDRGTKKDFIDLYFIAKKLFGFSEMLGFYDEKYHLLEKNMFTIMKSLSFFLDAENSEMPKMLEKVTWQEIKTFFEKESVRLANKYL